MCCPPGSSGGLQVVLSRFFINIVAAQNSLTFYHQERKPMCELLGNIFWTNPKGFALFNLYHKYLEDFTTSSW